MKKIWLSLFLVSGLWIGHVFSAELVLGPTAVLQLAAQHNRDLKISSLQLKKSVEEIEKAHVKFRSRVDLEIQSSREDYPSMALGKTVDERNFSFATANLNHPGQNSHFETALQWSYPLYLSGLQKMTIKIADLELQKSSESIKDAKNMIFSVALEFFYRYMIALEQKETEELSLQRIQTHLNEIEVKYKGGSVLKTDVLSMKVRAEEVRLRLVAASARLEIAKAGLLTFLGVSLSENVKVQEDNWKAPQPPSYLLDAYSLGYRQRGDIRIQEILQNQAQTAVDMTRASNQWQVGLFARWQTNQENPGWDISEANWLAGIKVSKNLFDSGLRDSEVRIADFSLEQSRLSREKKISDVELEIKRAWESYQQALQALSVSETNLALANENLNLMKKQYQGGSVTVTALLDADQAYTNAQAMAISFRYEKLIALCGLHRSLGNCSEWGDNLQN